MRTLAIGDIHGNYQGFVQCLERASFDNEKDRLISLGDIVDGGEDVFECVEALLSIKNLIAIKGNHDDWFLEFIQEGYHPANWTYGGKSTFYSYSKRVGKRHLIKATNSGYKTALDPKDIPQTHQVFFRSQKLYFIDEQNNLFVHAGFDRHLPFFTQRKENYYWDRELWNDALKWQLQKRYTSINSEPFAMATSFNEIFIGHTSTMHWNIDHPLKAANIINIDTGSRHNGRLTIIDVSTKQFWQSDLLKKPPG